MLLVLRAVSAINNANAAQPQAMILPVAESAFAICIAGMFVLRAVSAINNANTAQPHAMILDVTEFAFAI